MEKIVNILTVGLLAAFFMPNAYSQTAYTRALYKSWELELTGLEVQQKVGSRWETVEYYKTGMTYRVRLRITNKGRISDDPRQADIKVTMRLPMKKGEFRNRYNKELVWDETIKKGKSKWYTFGEFICTEKETPINKKYFDVRISYKSIWLWNGPTKHVWPN